MSEAVPSSPAATSIPSSMRPVPLCGRSDMEARPIDFQGTIWWVLKDPVGLKYYRLQAEHYRLLCLLDGNRSLKEIRNELACEFPAARLRLIDVQQMITSLHAQGLVLSQRTGQSGEFISKQNRIRRQRWRQSLGSLLSLRLPGWDPDATLQWLQLRLSWIYHPLTGILAFLLVISAWVLLLVQFDVFLARLPEFRQFFSWRNMAWLWLTLSITKIMHEFGHGLTCKHFGSECHEMGIMVLIFSPTLYCDVTDSWMLRDKWKRIWIGAAGMVVEVVISAIAILAWWFTSPGLLNHLCLNVFFVTTITTVIFNANPLLRYDGYYMLSDFLGVPNLREKATQQLRNTFAEVCLGVSSPPDSLMPDTGRHWFIVYAIASSVYSWIVLLAVVFFLYTVLKPYGLQSIGVAMAVLTVAGTIGSLIFSAWKIIAAPRSEPISRFRTSATIVAVLILVVSALAIPLPWYIEAPFLVEPHGVVHVVTTTAGELTSFEVSPGQSIERGQILARLFNDQKQDELQQIEVTRDSTVAEITKLHALELPADHAIARQRLRSIETQIAELKQQINELTIRAPIAGRIIAAPKTQPPPQSGHRQLSNWSGYVSHPSNLNCLLQPRTHLLSIAPDHRMQALLYIDQAHRDDLTIGQPIQIKFEHLPDETYHAKIIDIAREHSDVAPPGLTSGSGGELASVTIRTGQEKLTSVVYQARVVLHEETSLLKPGMRGTARFLVERHSAATWLWRAFRRTMNFRI